jgi:hypothetical protein
MADSGTQTVANTTRSNFYTKQHNSIRKLPHRCSEIKYLARAEVMRGITAQTCIAFVRPRPSGDCARRGPSLACVNNHSLGTGEEPIYQIERRLDRKRFASELFEAAQKVNHFPANLVVTMRAADAKD